ncbi:hypothetical protein ETD83_10745 [Actinomadura soli]|uniref:PIN like domain-containing protein n=1 Tax=Actinomadura soli TaxID=2508997 RepID=A0A5C4JEI4_9ACTN|nr:PIN domain-containing protein [Actinomadura soli]TMR03378.1 hypothetical protein ETD83_10745 [Actinomadura soli]
MDDTPDEMPDSSSSPTTSPAAGGGLRDMYVGLCPPGNDVIKESLTGGLVVADTNALFNIYRFNQRARTEYLAALRALGDRLWIPRQVAEEFLNRRHSVIKEAASAPTKFAVDLGAKIEQVRITINEFAERRGLLDEQVDRLRKILDEAVTELHAQIAHLGLFDLNLDEALLDDPIFNEIEHLINGKIGPPLDDPEQARKEGWKRVQDKAPPGYADGKKGENGVGDYLLWAQTIEEAKRRNAPTLLITDDSKEDWARLDEDKEHLGPRPELVEEMRDKAGQPFYLVTVRSFLALANKYLETQVSDATFDQAALTLLWQRLNDIRSRRAEAADDDTEEDGANHFSTKEPATSSALSAILRWSLSPSSLRTLTDSEKLILASTIGAEYVKLINSGVHRKMKQNRWQSDVLPNDVLFAAMEIDQLHQSATDDEDAVEGQAAEGESEDEPDA